MAKLPPEAFESGSATPYDEVLDRYPRATRAADLVTIDRLKNPLAKAFDPSQPRDQKGRWSASGGGIKQYLGMISEMTGGKAGIDKFILDHGRAYKVDKDTFQGGTAHECYKNASLAAMADDDLTYVEGYVSVHGIPIHHAWVADQAGNVRDVTIEDGKGILGYYGVPIRSDFLTKTLLANKIYGVTTWNNVKRLLAAEPSDVVEG